MSPLLFGVAVLYAAGGSLFTIVLGRPLIRLNYDQLDKEANFRSELLHVRDNSEAIMQARDEESQTARLLSRLDDPVGNFRRITSVNRNVGFFTTGYNWLIQMIPALIIAPAFIEGKIEFGVITQSAMAFTALVAAFSLVVTQFQSLSSFAAVIARLSALAEAIGQTGDPRPNEAGPGADKSSICSRRGRRRPRFPIATGRNLRSNWPSRARAGVSIPRQSRGL